MELKHNSDCSPPAPFRRLNRTFMELKLGIRIRDDTLREVLIVPLWN